MNLVNKLLFVYAELLGIQTGVWIPEEKYLKENKTISKEISSQYFGFASGVRILIDSQHDPSIDAYEKLTMLFKKYPLTFKKN